MTLRSRRGVTPSSRKVTDPVPQNPNPTTDDFLLLSSLKAHPKAASECSHTPAAPLAWSPHPKPSGPATPPQSPGVWARGVAAAKDELPGPRRSAGRGTSCGYRARSFGSQNPPPQPAESPLYVRRAQLCP